MGEELGREVGARASIVPQKARYALVRQATERLARPLSAEDQSLQSMPDASPTKWHRAHTTWFFETFVLEPLGRAEALSPPVYKELFNSYYHGVGPQYPRPRRGLLSRPSELEVMAYRAAVDAAMGRLFDDGLDPRTEALVELGLHHEQQHQELILADILHLFAQNPMGPRYREGKPPPAREPGPMRFVEHAGGLVVFGQGPDGFAFDHERPRHRVYLEPFALADRLVTWGEYLAFVEDGGYLRPELWLSEGFAWVEANEIAAPLYARQDERGYEVFTLYGWVPVDKHAPVTHLSYFEADAFARWAGARLPTEAEWESAAGEPPVEAVGAELDALAAHDAAPGFYGQVYQWTSSAYGPYPGFRPTPGMASEYNGKFMCNQLVLRGSSAFTPKGHARRAYRNYFPPSARWQLTGIRLAKDVR